MFVLGFQEIVPLTAQQIVQADPDKRYAVSVFIFLLELTCSQAGLGGSHCEHTGEASREDERLRVA